jgi:hypothetical protein
VGLAVGQLARVIGLRVLGLASSAKHAVLRELGVEPFDSRASRWWEAVRQAAPAGIDIVLDSVGGASYRRSYGLLAPGGRLVCIGVAALSSGRRRAVLHAAWQLLQFPRFWTIRLMNDNRGVAGINLGKLWNVVGLLRPQLDALLDHARAGRLRPWWTARSRSPREQRRTSICSRAAASGRWYSCLASVAPAAVFRSRSRRLDPQNVRIWQGFCSKGDAGDQDNCRNSATTRRPARHLASGVGVLSLAILVSTARWTSSSIRRRRALVVSPSR